MTVHINSYDECFSLCVEQPCNQENRNACIRFAVKMLHDVEQQRCPEKIENVTRRTDGICSQVMIGFLLGGALGAQRATETPEQGKGSFSN